MRNRNGRLLSFVPFGLIVLLLLSAPVARAADKTNIVVLMTDDTGWNDFGAYSGGGGLGHATPNIDRIAKEGAVFTNWYDRRVALPDEARSSRVGFLACLAIE